MAILFSQIQDRILPMRSDDLKPRQGLLAFQIAARRLATESLALQDIVEFEITENSIYADVYDEETEELACLFIFKAEYQKSDGSWEPLGFAANQIELKNTTWHTYDTPGTMQAFTSDQGRFWPNRPPDADTQVRAVIAYKPLGDFDEVGFGHECEDALVWGALSHLYRLPGSGRDLALADDYENRFLSEASAFRGAALVGDANYARGSAKPKQLISSVKRQDKLEF